MCLTIISDDNITTQHPDCARLAIENTGPHPIIQLIDDKGKLIHQQRFISGNILRVEVLRGVTVCRIHKNGGYTR